MQNTKEVVMEKLLTSLETLVLTIFPNKIERTELTLIGKKEYTFKFILK